MTARTLGTAEWSQPIRVYVKWPGDDLSVSVDCCVDPWRRPATAGPSGEMDR